MLQSDWVGEKRAAGYVMGLIGANGADKTMAIRCLLGMRGFKAGEIELLGCRVPGPRSPCASNQRRLRYSRPQRDDRTIRDQYPM